MDNHNVPWVGATFFSVHARNSSHVTRARGEITNGGGVTPVALNNSHVLKGAQFKARPNTRNALHATKADQRETAGEREL